ncbi:hypothetical protein Rrhod_0741 [Rhodococcus rhodnii LMG 5362]|uniref:Uncharacterized protein n=1 Tax=Rhodococcus rhodnii LMG 5362 TaxID=1273125 RepID=R7WRH6_9NOCA|nr:hypothetical protein Rrhod_0741 [Rhodococcus rhodnii LMG 5362]
MDTQFASNPKILDLISRRKHRAIVVWMASLGYAGAHETDGFVPAAALPFLHGGRSDATDLVMARLWHAVEGGYAINDWDEYQWTSDAHQDRRQKAESASKKANCVRWHGKECGCWKRAA